MNYRYGLLVIMVALPLVLATQLPTYTVLSSTVPTTLKPGSSAVLGRFSFNYNASEAVIEVNATQVSGNFDVLIYNGTYTGLLVSPSSNSSGFIYNSTSPSAASGQASPTGIPTNIPTGTSVASLASLKPLVKQEFFGGKVGYVKVTPSYKLSSFWLVVNSTEASGKLTVVMRDQTLPVPSYYLSAGLVLLLIGLALFAAGLATSLRHRGGLALPLPDGAIVMCGGRAERFGGKDKGCVFFHGKPLAERVAEALRRSGLRVLFAFATRTACSAAYASMVDGVSLLETPGEGYVADLRYVAKWASSHLGWRRALVVGCDMPLLTKDVVRKLLEMTKESQAPVVNVLASGKELSSLGFEAKDGELVTSVSVVDLLELSLSAPEAELPWESVSYSPAQEVWDCDDQKSLEVFESLWKNQGEKGRTS